MRVVHPSNLRKIPGFGNRRSPAIKPPADARKANTKGVWGRWPSRPAPPVPDADGTLSHRMLLEVANRFFVCWWCSIHGALTRGNEDRTQSDCGLGPCMVRILVLIGWAGVTRGGVLHFRRSWESAGQLAVVASLDWRRGGRLGARGSQSPSLGAGSDPCGFRVSLHESENGSVASCLGKGDVQGTMLFVFEDEPVVHRVRGADGCACLACRPRWEHSRGRGHGPEAEGLR